MSDTTNPREEDNLLVEGENHELLGNPESILEIAAPDETLLIVAGTEIPPEVEPLIQVPQPEYPGIEPKNNEKTEKESVIDDVYHDALGAVDQPIESIMSPVLEMSPESVSVVESIQETDPTLFDQFDTPETTPDVIPETTPEIVPDTVTVTVADVSISETPTVEIEPIAPEPTSVLTIESVTAATSSIPATPPVLPDIGLIVPPTIASLQKDASLMSQIQQVQPHTSHKKTIILVLLAIFLIGVGAAAFWWLSREGVDTKETKPTDEPIAIVEPTVDYQETLKQEQETIEKNIDLMNNAVSTGDIVLCEGISEEGKKQECSESVMAKSYALSGTIEDCATIQTESIRTSCQSSIKQSTAMTSFDKDLCSELATSGAQQSCRDSIDEKVFARLIEMKTANETSCSTLDEKYREKCLATIEQVDDNSILQNAIKNDDLEACRTLTDEVLQFDCFDTILLNRALVSKDKNLCDLVRDEERKTRCMTYTVTQDDNALFKAAVIEKDIKVCAEITTELLNTRCHDAVTVLVVRDTKNPALCDTLKNPAGLDTCKKAAGIQ